MKPYGEWPPSPWRLLLASPHGGLIQSGNRRGNIALRDMLLSKLARDLPSLRLPDATWRGIAIKQYQPTGVGWSDAQKKNPGYKRPGTTLVQDHYRVVPAGDPIYWFWEATISRPQEAKLLSQLLRRLPTSGGQKATAGFASSMRGQ